MVDKQDNTFSLTDIGQAKADECWEVAGAHAEDSFGDFTDEQMDTFTTVLKGLV